MRDEFSKKIKDILAKRVGSKCSNPACRQQTSGPQEDKMQVVNVGVAAHITAAAPGGPRYDSSITSEDRKKIENGIWLCQKCAKLIDDDEGSYTKEILEGWKQKAEAGARAEVEGNSFQQSTSKVPFSQRIERLMAGLLNQMQNDVFNYPLSREFVIYNKSAHFWNPGHVLEYYYEEHDDLDNMITVLENLRLVRDVTHTNVKKYVMEEHFIDYLESR